MISNHNYRNQQQQQQQHQRGSRPLEGPWSDHMWDLLNSPPRPTRARLSSTTDVNDDNLNLYTDTMPKSKPKAFLFPTSSKVPRVSNENDDINNANNLVNNLDDSFRSQPSQNPHQYQRVLMHDKENKDNNRLQNQQYPSSNLQKE